MSKDLKTLIEKKFEFNENKIENAWHEWFRNVRPTSQESFTEGARWKHEQMKQEILPVLLECVEALRAMKAALYSENIDIQNDAYDSATQALERLRKWSESK